MFWTFEDGVNNDFYIIFLQTIFNYRTAIQVCIYPTHPLWVIKQYKVNFLKRNSADLNSEFFISYIGCLT